VASAPRSTRAGAPPGRRPRLPGTASAGAAGMAGRTEGRARRGFVARWRWGRKPGRGRRRRARWPSRAAAGAGLVGEIAQWPSIFWDARGRERRPGEREDEEEPRNPCVFNVPELFAPRRSEHLELEMRWRGGTRSRRRNSQALQVACCPALTEISTVKVI
jgi:hypothetical protein